MRGRSNRTAIKRETLLRVITSGASLTAAARAAGMSWRSVYDWRAADPAFNAEVENAYDHATDRIADHALKRALLPGKEHDTLLIYLLKQRDPARFNRKMVDVQVGGTPNRPVTVAHQAAPQPEVRLIIVPHDDARYFAPTPTPTPTLTPLSVTAPDGHDSDDTGTDRHSDDS